jgi:hypothetical protein
VVANLQQLKLYNIQDESPTCQRGVQLYKGAFRLFAEEDEVDIKKGGTHCIEYYFDFDVSCHQHALKLHILYCSNGSFTSLNG